MMRVAQECDRTRQEFAPESVHDLRVALRRCRSIAGVFMAFDPHPGWRQMKSEAKELFGQLGEIRDAQVLIEWAQHMASIDVAASESLIRHLSDRESALRKTASEALRKFDRKKWLALTRRLSGRTRHVSPDHLAFQHLALERWMQARALHRQALRNRSHAAYHRLRIGLKKFRYVVENFLPSRHEVWGGDLRQLQDLLGEMHDLHMLWQTARTIRAFRTEAVRVKWRQRISEEIGRRIELYRQKMLSAESLWTVWRSGLPRAEQMDETVRARLRLWASFHDPDFAHSEYVTRLALQIYDGLDSLSLLETMSLPNARFLLEAAALAHGVGRYTAQKKYWIRSYRMLRKLNPSPGLDAESLNILAIVARYHRGALPNARHKAFSPVPPKQMASILLLCGILRLAAAFGRVQQKHIPQLVLKRTAEVLQVEAQGYSETDEGAETLAAARYLLETACHMPIWFASPGLNLGL